MLWALWGVLCLSTVGRSITVADTKVQCEWSRWLDRDQPTGDGDFETLTHHLRANREELCSDPVDVEGRVKRKHTDALQTGQTIELSTSVGLICRNTEQTCLDYEVRFCCSSKPRCINGEWTSYYYSVDTPDGDGDYETIRSIRRRYPGVCENPTAIDARRISDGVHFQSVFGRRGQIKKIGNKVVGFECRHGLSQLFPLQLVKPGLSFRCDDYEVRLCCPKLEAPACGPNGWSIWMNRDNPDDGCDVEALALLRQDYPDAIKCDKPTAIDVRIASSGIRYDPTAPHLSASPTRGFKCCNRFRHECRDYEVRFCCQNELPIIPHCDGKWTRFYDRDNPSGYGDYETLEHLRQENEGEICRNPTAIDARLVGTNVHHPVMGQVVTLNLETGFYCVNSKQKNKRCLDYEARFCCPKDPPNTCEEDDWTDYHSIDDPISGINNGDVEDLATASSQILEVCPNPTAMEVRLLNGAPYLSVNQQVHLSLADGFSCLNNEQKEGEICCDYKVRYCCPLAPPPSCDKCIELKGKWTEYFNVDKPTPVTLTDNCDCEYLWVIRRKNPKVCRFPIEIDVRTADDDQVYTSTGQDVEVSPFGGFRCKNNGQRCLDYKVRFCCPEEEKPIGDLSWCTASGDPHFRSLDGKRFDFQGTCTYTYVKTTEEAEMWHLYPFKVEVEHNNRGNPTVSYVEKVIFKINSVVVELLLGLDVQVNGVMVTVPHTDLLNGFQITNIAGFNLQLETVFGLRIVFDGYHIVQIGVPDNYKEHVEGLCGNYNADPDDDFTLAGTTDQTTDVDEFGESHKTDDDCTSNRRDVRECQGNEEGRSRMECQASFQTSGQCLADCAENLSTAPFVNNCVYDACALEDLDEGIENSLEAFKAECSISGFVCDSVPSNPPNCTGTWTRFFDFSDVDDVGDNETLENFRNGTVICERPTAIDARVVGTMLPHPVKGQVVELDVMTGLVCFNDQQLRGECMDYEVRYCC